MEEDKKMRINGVDNSALAMKNYSIVLIVANNMNLMIYVQTYICSATGYLKIYSEYTVMIGETQWSSVIAGAVPYKFYIEQD